MRRIQAIALFAFCFTLALNFQNCSSQFQANDTPDERVQFLESASSLAPASPVPTAQIPRAIPTPAPAPTVRRSPLTFDDFNDRSGITGPYLFWTTNYGNFFSLEDKNAGRQIGYADTVGGNLEISHVPHNDYSTSEARRVMQADFSKPVWLHFRFRFKQMLYGQDMYTAFRFVGENGAVDGSNAYITIGINSDTHWKSVYAIGHGAACSEKDLDDELFFSISPQIFPGYTDFSVKFPQGIRKKITDWMVFSIQVVPEGGRSKLLFYLDGLEIPRTDVSNPNNSLPLYTDYKFPKRADGLTDIVTTFTALIDGDEASFIGNNYGTRSKGCYQPKSPAIPSPVPVVTNVTKLSWMEDFDKVARVASAALTNTPGGRGMLYTTPQTISDPFLYYSTVIHRTPQVRFWNSLDAMFNPYNPTYPLDPAHSAHIRSVVRQAIWDAIYRGEVPMTAAILMGILELPGPEHPNWPYEPPGTRNRIAGWLQEMAASYPNTVPWPKRYVWNRVMNVGGAFEAVRLGYLYPEDVRDTSVWGVLTDYERSMIPLPASPRPAELSWDYVIGGNAGIYGPVRPQLLSMMNEGRLPAGLAVISDLLQPADVGYQCPYLSCEDVRLIRTRAPAFCLDRCQ